MKIKSYKPYILAYGFIADRLEKLRGAAAENEIGIKLIQDGDLDTIVRDLLVKPEDKPSDTETASVFPFDKTESTSVDDKAVSAVPEDRMTSTSVANKGTNVSVPDTAATVSSADKAEATPTEGVASESEAHRVVNTSPPDDATPPEPGLEFILFVNMKQDALYAFIEVLHEKELSVPYKAGLTAKNIDWPLRDLIAANRQEHEFIKLYQGSKKALYFGAELYEKTQDIQLLERLENLLAYIKSIEKVQTASEQQADSERDEAVRFEELRQLYNALAVKINELVSGEGANT
ncbi:MAG TPA: DUF3783 domain-containing protein [Clostridiaceae bacterium]|nr:DUF3783 domain-containing protein [Clostridiaceae bacterium]